jgi:hypothetical protein
MKEIEHLPDEWYIKDSKAVSQWFKHNINSGISLEGWEHYFYGNNKLLKLDPKIENSYKYKSFEFIKEDYPNAIEITEDQLFNISKTKNKKDNKRLYEILNYIKQNA